MKKRLLALFCALAVGGVVTAKTVGATSPGGNLRMEIEVADKISYTVWSGADKVLDACTLSLTLADRTLGEAPRLRSVKRSSADEMLERRNPTKDAVVRNCYNAVQLRFAGDYAVEFRLFDDGVAYRFVTSLPGEVEVLGEECRLGLPAGSEAVALRGERFPFDVRGALHSCGDVRVCPFGQDELPARAGRDAGGQEAPAG